MNSSTPGARPRLAVVWDPPDEGWLSMELAAEMLTRELQQGHATEIECVRVQPPAVRLFRRAFPRSPGQALNGDRILTRFLKYPARMAAARSRFELFHLTDYTYAQLANVLPRARTGVYVHDLNAFECILEPSREPRSAAFRAMTSVILRGLRRAAVVFTSTRVTKRRMRELGLVESGNIVVAPYGVGAEFIDARGAELPRELAAKLAGRRYVLHVGSHVPRKRLDVLFEVFSELRRADPELLLVQQGARLTPQQLEQVARLDLHRSLVRPPYLNRTELAALYRGAALTLVPSDNEGFGLPVLEALASGSRVLASDLPTMKEAGGVAADYCPVGDIQAWMTRARQLLADGALGPSHDARRLHVSAFTWERHAETIWKAYASLLERTS